MNSKFRKQPVKHKVQGQPSWRMVSKDVEAFVTEIGGHLGPVTFERLGRKIRPFSVAPWTAERFNPPLQPIIQVLRGDFFCLPFGGNGTPYRGEQHSIHGETANAKWAFESLEMVEGRMCLHLSLKTKVRAGYVDKRIYLVDGQNVVYSQHIISGMSGPMNPGHHAMLKFPDTPGSGLLSTSRFVYAQVLPQVFEEPAKGGYSALRLGAEFTSLEKVPMLNGETADLSRFPARRGFEDLVMLVSEPNLLFAWSAVASYSTARGPPKVRQP